MGPRHHSNPHNTIVMQAFDPQTGTLSPERKTLFTGTPLCYTEGAHLYRHAGWYYLMVAEGAPATSTPSWCCVPKTSTGRTSCTRT